jgi:membrane associated rhomboid family serine protease
MGKIHTLSEIAPTFDDWADGRGGKSDNGFIRVMQMVFPGFNTSSTTFAWILINICIFTIMAGIAVSLRFSNWFCLLYGFGAQYTYAVTHKFQIWRLITPIFVHNSFRHLFFNTFSLLLIGFIVEAEMQSRAKYVTLVLLGGISGNLLSGFVMPYTIAVGASGALYAITGTFVIWVWLNFGRLGPNKYLFLIIFIVLFMFSLMNAASSGTIDIYSHVGGFIVGIPMGILFLRVT